jgi:transcriptional regulator with XRE-family HTH domain
MSTQQAHAYGTVPSWTFGDKVRKARDTTGLGQKEFAAKIGVTASSLAAYETGRAAPRFRDAPVIAASIQLLTGIPREWFLVEDGPQPINPTKVQQKDYKPAGSLIRVDFGERRSITEAAGA